MATTISDKPNIFIRRPILSMVISIVITPGWSAGDRVALPIAPVSRNLCRQRSMFRHPIQARARKQSPPRSWPLSRSTSTALKTCFYMTSTSASGSGSGSISVYFSLGTDRTWPWSTSTAKVNLAQTQLPEEVRRQGVTVTKRSPGHAPGFLLLFARWPLRPGLYFQLDEDQSR